MILQNTVRVGTLRQAFATFTVNLGVLGLGTVVGWTSAGLSSLAIDLPTVGVTERSWIGAIVHLGALLACLLGACVIDKLGRKRSMILFTFPFMIGWIILICARNVAMVYVGRFLTGFAAGFYGISGPVFVGEIADAKIRGFLSNGYGVFLTLGMLLSYTFGYFWNWQITSILCSGIPLLLLVLLFVIPESPRYYVQMEKHDEALKSLLWYRGTASESDVMAELDEMRRNSEELKTASKKTIAHDLVAPGALRPLLISIALVVFEQFSGFPAIVAYTGEIFKSARLQLDSNLLTIAFGSAQVVATVVSALVVDKLGRRILLILSQFLNCIALVVLGSYFYLRYTNTELVDTERLGWIPLTCLVLYISSFSAGIGPISTSYMGECLSQTTRGVGSAICTAILRLIAFTVAFGFDGVAYQLGIEWCFWMFSIVCISGVVFVYFFVPETKGKSLEEIRQLFLNLV